MSTTHTSQIVTETHTPAWRLFTIASFLASVVMLAGGIFFMEATFAAKGFYAMSALMLFQTSVSVTKTLRDEQEAQKFINRLEDAKTEKLLMDVTRNSDS
jgi:hypothetical protein